MPSVHAATPELAAPLASSTTVDGRITAPVLVDVRWLATHHDAVRVLDTRPARDFAAGHLPGSRSLPLHALLVDDTSRPALQRLAAATRSALATLGIAPDDHVVLVDGCDGTASLGATLCELAGMRRVSVVQGSGVDEWRVLGGSLVDTVDEAPQLDADAWSDTTMRSTSVAAFEDLVDAVVDGSATVLDARSQLEHEGIVGAPCCAGRGAVPGSVHVEWTTCFDMFGAPLAADRVVELLAQVGVTPNDAIIVTCHAGHRAAVAARVLRASGFRDVRVSLGSWHEWSLRGLGEDTDDEGQS